MGAAQPDSQGMASNEDSMTREDRAKSKELNFKENDFSPGAAQLKIQSRMSHEDSATTKDRAVQPGTQGMMYNKDSAQRDDKAESKELGFKPMDLNAGAAQNGMQRNMVCGDSPGRARSAPTQQSLSKDQRKALFAMITPLIAGTLAVFLAVAMAMYAKGKDPGKRVRVACNFLLVADTLALFMDLAVFMILANGPGPELPEVVLMLMDFIVRVGAVLFILALMVVGFIVMSLPAWIVVCFGGVMAVAGVMYRLILNVIHFIGRAE